MLYRAEPHSDKNAAYSLGFRTPQEAELRILIPVNVGLKTQILPAGEAAVAAAARCLAAGGLVAFPTETVYGLGADATNAAAIARLYQAKGRPAFNPLIAHVGDLAAARRIAPFRRQRDRAGRGVLAGAADAGAAEDARTARSPISPPPGSTPSRSAFPPHPVAREILRAFGGPVVAPSANLSGHVSPTTAAHVQSDLAGRIDLIVDGGAVAVGVESTIVGCFETPMLLRPGGLPRDEIERVLGRALVQPPAGCRQRQRPAAGAGHAGLALRAAHAGAAQCRQRRARRSAAGVRPDCGAGRRCSRGGHEFVGARRSRRSRRQSFRLSSRARRQGARAIAVMPVPHHGLGEAINDRLRRAAVGRE